MAASNFKLSDFELPQRSARLADDLNLHVAVAVTGRCDRLGKL